MLRIWTPLVCLASWMGVSALSPRLEELWGDRALMPGVLDADNCWKLALESKANLGGFAADLFITLGTEKPDEWQEALLTYNEPASCYFLQCPDDIPDCTDRILIIEGESELETQPYCVEDLGAPDLPGTSVPREPTCGAPIAHCGHITTDRLVVRDGKKGIKIRFSCRESCAEPAIIPYKFRAYLSNATYDLKGLASGAAAGSDILDQYCEETVDYSDFPSAQEVADCSTELCPPLTNRDWLSSASAPVTAGLVVLLTIATIVATGAK